MLHMQCSNYSLQQTHEKGTNIIYIFMETKA